MRRLYAVFVCLLCLQLPGHLSEVQAEDNNARPLTDRTFERTPARLERGRYLVEGVAQCFHCHSEIDLNAPGAPPLPGKKGGGKVSERSPWLVAPNISPDPETGAGAWTDDMFARAIREGIGHEGRALLPVMPYREYRVLSDEDLTSIVVYVRSIEPVRNALPKMQIPERLKGSLTPEPVPASVPAPDLSDPVRRGAYLVRIGACAECHSRKTTDPKNFFQPIPGLEFAGGVVFKGPWGKVASANLTPDPSGIPYYDEALFLQAMRTGRVGARKLNPVMPWGYFQNMTDEDLKAIFAYLKTLNPVKHSVDNTEPPTDCKLCGQKHGGGERN